MLPPATPCDLPPHPRRQVIDGIDVSVATTLQGLATTVYEVSTRLSTEVAAFPSAP